MHASRNRSGAGNGYRSSFGGMGLASSRMSPEGSFRGHGFYNSSDYRHSNRGFGRVQSKPYHHQPLREQSRRGDVFLEAGRLAAEYLVSKGLLSAAALSFASKKKHVGDLQEFKPREGGGSHFGSHFGQEGSRPSVHARLGHPLSDAGSSRRKFPDEDSSTSSRSHGKGRRRHGTSRSYTSSLSRDNEKSDSSWSDKAGASLDMEADVDYAPGYEETQWVGKDSSSGMSKSFPEPSESAPKGDDANDSGSKSDRHQLPNPTGSNSSGSDKDAPPVKSEDQSENEKADVSETINTGKGEVKDGFGNDDMEIQEASEDLTPEHCAVETGCEVKSSTDLLKFCRIPDMPKRTRSSLMHKGSKIESLPINEEESIPNVNPPKESGVSIGNDSFDGPLTDAFSNPMESPDCSQSDICKTMAVQSVEDIGDLSHTYSTDQSNCTRSQSLHDQSFLYKQEVQRPLAYGQCSLAVKERGEKRPAQQIDATEENKKPREWQSSLLTQDNENFILSNLREKELSSQEGRALIEDVLNVASNHDNLASISPFSKGSEKPHIDYAEEKQSFPSSFKICDLNDMEASDISGNHVNDPILMFPPVSETNKNCASADMNLSMNNSCSINDEHVRHAADGNDIEVIDLENDSLQNSNMLDNAHKKEETVFTSLEGFPSNLQSSNDINDVQDNYGLMVSELLANDISNCSPVTADMNSLHHEMGLHNGGGILGDDDSIYMSLGEIPISFLPGWGQPTQDFEKPF